MAESKSGVVSSTLKNPLISGLMIVLVLLIVGSIGNFSVGLEEDAIRVAHIRYLNELKTGAQETAKNAIAAAIGQMEVFSILSENQARFDTNFDYLKKGDPQGIPKFKDQIELNKIGTLWAEAKILIDIVDNNRDALVFLNDISGDLEITLSQIQQEDNKIVASMLRLNFPANQVALAQQQNLLVERMSRSIDKIIQIGSSKSLMENFSRDRGYFIQVLRGLTEGDRKLLLVAITNTQIQTSLAKIDELFRTVSDSMNEISARSEDVATVRNAARDIYLASDEFTRIANRLIQSQQNGPVQIGSPQVSLILFVFAFLVVFSLGFLFYREANRVVGETAVQNEQNQAAILQLLDEMADLADGDLRVQATVTESFTGAIADSINFSIDQLRTLVSKINEASSMVSTATEQTQLSLGQLSDASKRQAKEIADVSEAVNEMAVSIDQVSYNAAESSSVAERSVTIANKGASVVQNTIGGMENIRGQIQETAKRIKRLGESSQEIGDIVALINDISDQTNILSLNAAIQASMAGDAGKGFAVVADEVQRLAERSGAAAKQIAALVKTIQSDTNEAVISMEQTTAEVVQGTRLAQDAGVALGEIDSVSKSLAEIIENISDAARQQAESAGKISNTMKSIEDITSQTNEGTQATVVAVGNLADITNELRASVTGFKLPG